MSERTHPPQDQPDTLVDRTLEGLEIHTDRARVCPSRVVALLEAAGWGAADGTAYADTLRISWQFYEVVVFAERAGELVGYATGYSDGAFTTGMGELVVHPDCRKMGIGRRLLRIVEERFPDVPFYVKTFRENVPFFEACGFTHRPEMVVLSKRRSGSARWEE